MSTPGPERVPSTVKVDKTSGQGKPPEDKAGEAAPKAGAGKSGAGKPGVTKPAAKPTKSTGGKPGARPGAKGGKGRKPVAPVKVTGRSWGPIALSSVVGLVVLGIIGYAVFASVKGPKTWQDKADAISGLVDFRKKDPDLVKGSQHQAGPIKYAQSPPVAGPHNPIWQNCNGNVYTAQIPSENAVHALEHGSVWITYKPDLPADQVAKLADKVNGIEKMLMSPYPGLDSAVSLQAWGFQLKVDSASDSRIDEFIKDLRVNASIEGPTAACDGGVTATGSTPANTAAGMK